VAQQLQKPGDSRQCAKASAAKLQEKLNRTEVPSLDVDQANKQLHVLGYQETDTVIFCNWSGDDFNHQRCTNLDDSLRVRGGSYHFGFVTGVSKPLPEGWRPKWHDDWDDRIQACWKAETYGTKAAEIDRCLFLMVDCDGSISMQRQEEILSLVGMPTPTLVVDSGRRGGHFYWVYDKPLQPPEHKHLMLRLIRALKQFPEFQVDGQIHNPNRVMRLAGSIHAKTGNRASIHACNEGLSYSVADFDFLPDVDPQLASISRKTEAGEPLSEHDVSRARKMLNAMSAAPSQDVLDELGVDGYSYWLFTGFACFACGLELEEWDAWSQGNTDPEHGYKDNECAAKWGTFTEDTNKDIRWLYVASRACGFDSFDPSTLKKGWKKQTAKERRQEQKELVTTHKPQTGEWFNEFDWELQETRTIQTLVADAIATKYKSEQSQLIYLKGRFFRYLPDRGYYKPYSLNSVKLEVMECLGRIFSWKKKSDDFVVMRKSGTTANLESCTKWLGLHFYVDHNEWEREHAQKPAIAFRNGTAVFTNGRWELQPHSPSHGLTHGIDHDFIPQARCPELFREFVRTSYGEDLLDVWRALFNYHANPAYPPLIYLFILGRSGSGKGVMLRLLQQLYPREQISIIHKFSAIEMPEKLAQLVAQSYLLSFPDLQGRQDDPGSLYSLADLGQPLTGRDLFSGEPFSFQFLGRIVMASTSLPNMRDGNSGFRRRTMIIRTLDELGSSPLLPRGKTQAMRWEKQLASELGQLVSWALGMTTEQVETVLEGDHPALREATEEAAATIDTTHSFIDQCLEPAGSTCFPSVPDLFSAYRCYLESVGQKSNCQQNELVNRLRGILGNLHMDGKRGKNRYFAARFYGFRIRPEVWSRDFSVKREMKSPIRCGEDHGTLDRAALSPGNLAALEAHRPSEPTYEELEAYQSGKVSTPVEAPAAVEPEPPTEERPLIATAFDEFDKEFGFD